MRGIDFDGRAGRVTIAGAPEGVDALALGEWLSAHPARDLIHLARDDQRMTRLAASLRFFAPGIDILLFPAWDCLPYDRVSPNSEVVSRRIDTLTRLAAAREPRPRIVIATINAFVQRVPRRESLVDATRRFAVGDTLDLEELLAYLGANGYGRAETVREPGEYAVRGGLVDLFPAGAPEPVRIDLFGSEIERLRGFDALTQRTTGSVERITLKPAGEILLNPDSIARFRTGYRELFGAVGEDDELYEAISAGRRHPGMEHWLPLFHDGLDTLADYLPDASLTFDHQTEEGIAARFDQIDEFYDARQELMAARPTRRREGEFSAGPVYKPVPPERLYLARNEWAGIVGARKGGALSPFMAPEGAPRTVDAGGRRSPDFAEARARADQNLFDAVREAIARTIAEGRRVVIAGYSEGTRDRLMTLLADHGVEGIEAKDSWSDVLEAPQSHVTAVVLELEHGFVVPDCMLLSEQDILGDRLIRTAKPRRRSEKFIAEASSLTPGDLVVHVEHGIGRYDGLVTLTVGGAPHDCLAVLYDGDSKLFVPVENIEVLSRYGSEEGSVQLDRLGGAAWQARKSRIKKRIREIAEQLIKLAAARQLRSGPPLGAPDGAYGEFCARFPYPETEDQLGAIEDTIADLAAGRPMDRLICGDVGFGKTEVALRAAFVAVLNGYQVAIIVPTTLLARQHFATFSERFKGLPTRIEQLSRFVPAKRQAEIKGLLADGKVDIVVGTHTLLGKGVAFKNLGLLVVDEEQHFGVAQKERIKALRTEVHVLTLTATPIPRTLQLALSGVRDMSVIATPPVDRLAVRTFVMPYDPVIVREAILREHFRGGQTFYVCPRIEDLSRVEQRLRELVPEVRVAVAHGQMAPTALEDVMAAFYEHHYDVLLSTNIVESGLDIPTANTLIVHRADMFGLAQLYQLRGRIGRSKLRAYAYLTIPPQRILTGGAERRLQVMQTLDTLGAGFTLASHDLDIRGAGNLLGEEQSGHIREVGIELYQSMLEETVEELRAGEAAPGLAAPAPVAEWTPQITVGTSVLIPETYVADLGVRLGLYRRLASLRDRREIDAFAAELIDRFGPLPNEVKNLLQIIEIKQLCFKAGVERLDAGPKGVVLSFRGNRFSNPPGLVGLISKEGAAAKLRPDHKLVFRREWYDSGARIAGLQTLVGRLAEIAERPAA
ncbi:MAG: transcription-repair coupling factor [Alphaproteobacteria bacterium]